MARQGMVHALEEAHRVLAARGLLIDARPSSRLDARVQRETAGTFRTVGMLGTQRDTATDDRLSDRAIGTVKRARLFRPIREGGSWHRYAFADLAELRAYLKDHARLQRRIRWTATGRRAPRAGRFAIERPLWFEVLEKI